MLQPVKVVHAPSLKWSFHLRQNDDDDDDDDDDDADDDHDIRVSIAIIN